VSFDPVYPLYDPRFEHDACGVGFVADSTGASRDQVLRLALAGLGALGHRGAFAADGASSDGAGVLLPLEPAVRALLAPGLRGEFGVISLFLPTDAEADALSRSIVAKAVAAEDLTLERWRSVPVDPDALGQEARSSLPTVAQAIVRAPSGTPRAESDRRLLLARRRAEIAARQVGLDGFAVVSASSRTVVYKGLVAGAAVGALYPDLMSDLPVSHVVFHQRYATNTHPTWALAQPFRILAHNGEINTVRGNREQVRGRRARLGGRIGERLAALGPLLLEDVSDSHSLDEALDLMVASGWRLDAALLVAIPDAPALRTDSVPELDALRRRAAGLIAPWDGPAALAFSDGTRVGAMLDRNGLRPMAVTITSSGIVAAASEAGAVPLDPSEVVEQRRLGPGEIFLVDVERRVIRRDHEARQDAARSMVRAESRRQVPSPADAQTGPVSLPIVAPTTTTPLAARWIAGLDAERHRLDIKTMALEAHEPLWSMGDDTPTPGTSHMDRPVADHLRQSFAQVTNPPIDPERERIVMDLTVDLGRRAPLLAALPPHGRTLRLPSPFVADLASLERMFVGGRSGIGDGRRRRVRTIDPTWDPALGETGLAEAIDRIAAEAGAAARDGIELLVLSDRRFVSSGRLPVGSVLAAGAAHAALTDAGLRGQVDIIIDGADLLDVHTAAMTLASGASAVVPWLAIELAAELAGTRGAEDVTPEAAIANLLRAFEAGLRKVLARMGISTAASYLGGQLFEVLELQDEVTQRCFPAAPTWPGTVGFATLAARQLRRLAAAPVEGPGVKLHDPGWARYRSDGERHLYAPSVVKAVQDLAARGATDIEALPAYREALGRAPATVRDQLDLVQAVAPRQLQEVEDASRILRRFVGSAMSLGALSPEAHQALTIGLRRLGMAPNSGEGGEDPAWYDDIDGFRRDAAIKQVASARFGVTAEYLARAEQLEIKMAQGSKPGEGGQLPSKKVTPLIARLRRAQTGISLISPPPHHDIYSIEDLAQLIADLRAINPGARIGVKLVASLGIGPIAAGVAKAGADYIQVSGHAGGTGASPLSSIKHVGIPWELGLAEVHQVLMRNGLRDRVALRTDGGLQTGRDVVIAALLGAEEFGFGTAGLVALGCDMARQCHLDTCPTGIATQRDDLRAKFTGTPDDVVRYFTAVAEDVRSVLSRLGATTLGEVVGDVSRLTVATDRARTFDFERLLGSPAWAAGKLRRSDPTRARLEVQREPASPAEARLADSYMNLPDVAEDALVPGIERPVGGYDPHPLAIAATITNAERSFGAHTSGLIERSTVRRPIRWRLAGSAGQSFGAFANDKVHLELVGQANDYVGKGLSDGHVVVRPHDAVLERAGGIAIAGNACLYGATGGRLHLVGRAGIRFAVRNSGATAVVEGVGAHGCEYMTGGVVVILGPIGPNMGAGMTGGRAYLWDPDGTRITCVDMTSVRATRLRAVVGTRTDGAERVDEVRELLEAHRDAGSLLARQLLARPGQLGDGFWLIEPVGAPVPLVGSEDETPTETMAGSEATATAR
jgi:glutamate synthase domain-containing protein 2/glutamate synthase domain-containing protein 1/glutamate synthase domain-containing protein 3